MFCSFVHICGVPLATRWGCSCANLSGKGHLHWAQGGVHWALALHWVQVSVHWAFALHWAQGSVHWALVLHWAQVSVHWALALHWVPQGTTWDSIPNIKFTITSLCSHETEGPGYQLQDMVQSPCWSLFAVHVWLSWRRKNACLLILCERCGVKMHNVYERPSLRRSRIEGIYIARSFWSYGRE